MKKIFLVLIITGCAFGVQAQQSATPATDIVKADLKNTLANLDYTDLFMPKIAVSDAQKPAANKIFANYMAARKALWLSTRKNPAVYDQQQPALFNTFKTNLSAVLSTEQMNAFMATKPARGDKKNYLTGLFY
ncbi:MAG: hypothetical protein J7623_01890 [Chitinophaga sp.]|uniref:hypothetical protein n=1 Tax=Chitinophaga sp. TaxID=1869181 RepID=UPI001B05FCD5|nr:hypothetical protein [Chitinophaga sp.]MBO9727368.1 hypothetical protein [Chitinophaga sp.]